MSKIPPTPNINGERVRPGAWLASAFVVLIQVASILVMCWKRVSLLRTRNDLEVPEAMSWIVGSINMVATLFHPKWRLSDR
jgi:hypothetical protein